MNMIVLQREIGIVRAVKGYHVTIEGLPSVRINDVIVREDGVRALTSALKHDAVEATLLDNAFVVPGEHFFLTDQTYQMYLGDHLFGRVVNPLCDPIDGGSALPPKNTHLLPYVEAGTIKKRGKIVQQLHTGYALTDVVLPIGMGQRQLLMGPPQSGTSVFAREVMLHQMQTKNIVCIYVLIGKHLSEVQRIAHSLFETDAKKFTLLIATTARDMAPMHGIAPAVGMQVAEWYASSGKDVLIVLDDLYTHAKYLREMALLEGRLPGRESYPGDIFFQQAHLIERAGSFADKGSITMLPIIQTNMDSYTDLITTNIMGTTDGHLSFSPLLHAQGIFPPILDSESVTRVGKHTQTMVLKQLSTAVSSARASAREQERIAQFGQLSEGSRQVFETGRILQSMLTQVEGAQLPLAVQAVLVSLPFTTFDAKDVTWTSALITALSEAILVHSSYATLLRAVEEEATLTSFLAFLEKEFVSLCTKICRT